ncbi:uncharacterized protein [Blastocystis hominis]|uniref:inosine/xanthosine triphosphatase n=1 Tax=Blastocystis hominis TaxID=12968 RepID=D8LVZ3_BLAHO|nr:uncharacterized protein [Blastocystis hominis]CBK19982.2 unnamed protein product [Blastocystis hominis]|eukprot:XP_012894030.1 uncharacterized protein [Blastocystis hominis]
MKQVVVASKNPCKVEACKKAFERVFPNETFEFVPCSSDSGVSDQPFSEEETRKGSINRVNDALRKWKEDHDNLPSFVIGLEGGVKNDAIPLNDKDFEDSLMLFAWMAIYCPETNRWGFGRTGSFYIPREIVRLVKSGVELGVADDRYFGRVNSGQHSGTVGILTDEIVTRREYYEHALILALIPFLHPEMYPIDSFVCLRERNFPRILPFHFPKNY